MAFSKSFALGIIIGGSIDATVGRSFRTLEQRAKDTSGQLTKLKLGEALAADVSKYRTQLLRLQEARKAGTHDSAALNRQIGKAMAQYRRAADKAKEYGIDVRRLADEQRHLDVQIGRTTRAMGRQNAMLANRKARQALHGEMLGALGAAYSVSVPVRAALAFDAEKTRLSTLIDGAALQKTVRQALEMGRSKKNLASQNELLSINYALNSAGLEDSAARAGAVVVAKVKEVTDGSAEQVAEIVGTVYNNMAGSISGGVEEKFARIGDILTKTQFQYQIRDFGQLGESFKEGSKGAIKYNVGLAETAAVLGQLNSAGLQGGAAGTAFNAMLRQMTKAADQFGFSIERNADGTMNLRATLTNLQDSLGVFDDADEKADALQEAFGDEGSGVVLLLNALEKLKEGYRGVENSAGTYDAAHEKKLASATGHVKIFTNQVRGLGITLGNVLLPAVNTVISPLGTTMTTVAEMSERFPVLTQFVVGSAVGLVGLKVAALGSKYAFTFLSDGVEVAKGIMDFFRWSTIKTNAALVATRARVIGTAIAQRAGAVATGLLTAAQWAWNAAMTANPIGLVIAGVAALGVGAVWLYKKWEPFQKLVDRIWGGFKKLVSSPLGTLAGWFGGKEKQPTGGQKTGDSARVGVVSRDRVRQRAERLESSSAGALQRAYDQKMASRPGPVLGDAMKTKAPATPEAMRPAPGAVPRVSPASIAAKTPATIQNNQQYRITVHPSAGMDERAVGEEVRRQIEAKEAQEASRARGALHD